MSELLKELVSSLVTKPEAIQIEEIAEEGMTKYLITVDSEDVGRVIGRGGRRIQAIRTIMKAKGMMEQHRVLVDIQN